jgi:crotonobetainyl-CoA:carnitine CoA-transferase CaiB-like acyl-CoA transferase
LQFGGAAGWYCGKLLADLGADVVMVEPPGGDPARADPDLSFFYANAGKRSVTLDLEKRMHRAALRRLAAPADLVVDSSPPGALERFGLGFEDLRSRHPELVWASISPFGLTGPYAVFRGGDLIVSALGGAIHVIGEAADPPVVLAGEQAWKMASATAAAASLIALHAARRTGRGQLVEISALETMAAATHICGAAKYLEDGIVPRRNGTSLFASVPSGAYRCHDGRDIYLMVNRPAHWRELARWVSETTGNQEILDPMFDGPSSARQPYRELIDLFLGELFVRMTAEDAYAEGQRRHLAITPVQSVGDVARDVQLRARRYFTRGRVPDGRMLRMPGAPYRMSRTPWRVPRALSKPGEHTKRLLESRPGKSPRTRGGARGTGVVHEPALAGLRVLELTAGMAGPWIGRFMAYLGADVVKVESRDHPDVSRLYVSPREPEKGVQESASPWFTDWNAGKRFVALDLRRCEAVRVCKRLVACADVVVCNYGAGVLAKLGLGYRVLSKVRPGLVMLSSTGFGATGPRRDHVTWGPNIEALSGLSAASGFPSRSCTITQFAYPDAVGAVHGLVAVMAALAHRDRTGEGQHVDLAQYEATVSSLGEVITASLASGREPEKLGNASPRIAPHGCYRCRGEDRWCAVSMTDADAWPALCALIDRADLARDVAFATHAGRVTHRTVVDGALEAWTRERDPYDVMHALQGIGVAAGVAQTIEDMLQRDAQLAARGFFESIPHRRGGAVVANGIPLVLRETPGRTRDTGAPIGADDVEVLREWIGLGADEIDALARSGALQLPRED